MNAEQLNGLLNRLVDAHKTLGVTEKLSAVRNSLQQMASAPQEAAHQSEYTKNFEALTNALRVPPLNNFTVREQKLIDDLKLRSLIGHVIVDNIRNAVFGQQMTPALALERMTKIAKEIGNKLKEVEQVATGLIALGVEMGNPDYGVVEVGLYLPHPDGSLSLETVLKEGDDLNRLVSVAYEIIEGSPQSPEVAYLTSSDYGILVTLAPRVAKYLLEVIEKVMNIRKTWAESQQLYRQLRENGHDEKEVAVLEQGKRAKVDAEIEEAVRISISEISSADGGRKNELTIQMTKGIKLFLKKQEEGKYIDIRVGKHNDDELVDEDAPGPVNLPSPDLLATIEHLSARVHALESEKLPTAPALAPPTDT